MQEADELLDLVNKDNEVIGKVMREVHHANVAYYTARGEYWRGVASFVVNSEAKVWTPTRQTWRRVAPDGLDFAMAEHVQSGEDHLAGAVRGMKEELNLDVDADDLEQLVQFVSDAVGCIMRIYVYYSDETPNYNTDDYRSAEWLSIDELKGQLQAPGAKFKNLLPEALEALEQMLVANPVN